MSSAISVPITKKEKVSLIDAINELFVEVEKRNEMVARVDINRDIWKELRMDINIVDEEMNSEILRTGLAGYLWGADVHIVPLDAPMVWSERELPPDDGILWIRRGLEHSFTTGGMKWAMLIWDETEL